MKALIIGSNGQDGFYLSKILERNKIDYLCISRKGNCINGDVRDYDFISKNIKEFQPSYIFNFAANSTTEHSTLFENHQTICTGTLNILEAAKKNNIDTKIFITGSALQFQNKKVPIDENTPFEASSPYSIARIQSTYAARYYRNKFNMKVYVGYFFNHDSPLRTEQYINQKIVQSIKRIHGGCDEKLEIGNIDVKKEFNYAEDLMEAVWILVNQNNIYEAVIGSGEVHSIKEWLEYCFNKINKKWQKYVILKNDFQSEYNSLVCNPKKIKSLGWKPKVSFHQLADLMMGEI